MKRIVQLIPYDAIGGVEMAAKSIPTGNHSTLRFERHYLVNRSGAANSDGEHHGVSRSLYDPRPYLQAVWRLFRVPPDLLVVSLWRCALVLIALKIIHPRQKSVLFLHSTRDAHFVDKVVTRIAMQIADEIWVDSPATLSKRVPDSLQHKGRVISFLLRKESLPPPRNPSAALIFWGRLSQTKDLAHALNIFAKLLKQHPAGRFQIIGPDGGVETDLKELTAQLGITEHVDFLGAKTHAQIKDIALNAAFYLQTSIYEGMALSVVEAMQLGLVPIVTPVGEIAQYCTDGQNAILIGDRSHTPKRVTKLLQDPARYRQMSLAAAAYWQDQTTYRESFLTAAAILMANGASA